MKRKYIMKYFHVLVLLCCIFNFLIITNTYAKNIDHAEPKYVACPEGGKHRMLSRGRADVYAGSYPDTSKILLSKGCAFRCSKCGLLVFSQYNPVTGASKLGNYFVSRSLSDISLVYTAYWAGSDTALYNSSLINDDFVRGMEFVGTY